jgi:3-methyladenine DNA glycosylase AlkD
MTVENIIKEVRQYSEKDYAKWVTPILQIKDGGYGENDKLYGVRVPTLRKIGKEYAQIPLNDVEKLLHNEYHEIRLVGIFILLNKYKKNKSEKKLITELYLNNADYINNWDLVDLSAPHIVGDYVYNNKNELDILYNLSNSNHLWKERISIVSTQFLIKKGLYEPTIKLSVKFLTHPHHLIHKAVGWTLRELGKQDRKELYSFLDKYAEKMPRTMLRYSIERLDDKTRKMYLNKK